MNTGVVYAVFGYEAHNQDELTFDNGDRIIVLRKGDDAEREWWWSRIDDREGYVPRNLLGVSFRLMDLRIRRCMHGKWVLNHNIFDFFFFFKDHFIVVLYLKNIDNEKAAFNRLINIAD